MRYFLCLSFNGAEYHGWQKQKNARSVQEVLDEALSTILQETIESTGCGRTDTGVHARQFFAHFDINKEIPENFIFKLNSFLPNSIAIQSCVAVNDNLHARFNAIKRTYVYYLHFNKDPFLEDISYKRFSMPDIELMNRAAALLLGENSFECFCKGEPHNANYTCNFFEAIWIQKKDQFEFHVSANRFLRNMVRAIVGTLLQVGYSEITLEEFSKILVSKNRSDAGTSVPAKALFLERVEYPKTAFSISK